MKSIIRRSLPAALAATLVAGAAVTLPAVAATGDDDAGTTVEEDGAPPFGQPGVGHRLAHGLDQGEFAQRLADELGLTTDTVQGAIDEVKSDLLDERLAQAVEDGRLTSAQADELAAAIADGDHEAARDLLHEARLAGLPERLAERVDDGELTQEQADELLERAEDGELPRRRGRRGHGPHVPDGAGPGGASFAPPVDGEGSAA